MKRRAQFTITVTANNEDGIEAVDTHLKNIVTDIEIYKQLFDITRIDMRKERV